MKEAEQKLSSDKERKEKIRQRYKGVSEDQISVIPAAPKPDIFDREMRLRVAIYARVSTDDPNQTSSYELQKNHYTDFVNRNPNWELVDIYADEGISGTSLDHRVNFLRMINDCEAGKIDLIVTKSVSRFARNILDSVGFVRKLAAMKPPVGVFFETENINTFKSESEISLALVSAMAQEESHIKSEVMNSSIEMRFSRGIFLTPALLGYDNDENGDLVINEEEAKTVRLIFFMYIYGYSCRQIADTLTKLKRKTKSGRMVWDGNAVRAQLTNERHCGSVLARKTFTPDYLNHESRKNRLDRNQYFRERHHEPIISRKDFIYVQHMIKYAKNGSINILPVLHVVPDGLLAGYVTINPRWGGFKPADYMAACTKVADAGTSETSKACITVEKGDFDLRGYEIARSQFFSVSDRMILTVSSERMKFSSSCLGKISGMYVEILIHPVKRMVAVRKTSADNRLAFNWSRGKNVVKVPRDMSVCAISACIFELLGCDTVNSYRIFGTQVGSGDSSVMLFDASETEIIIPGEKNMGISDDQEASAGGAAVSVKKTVAYPASWAEGFGVDYYSHCFMYESTVPRSCDPVVISSGPVVYNADPEIEIPDRDIVSSKIRDVLKGMASAEDA